MPGLVFKDLRENENEPMRTSTLSANSPASKNTSSPRSSSGLVFNDLLPIPHSNHANEDEHGRANHMSEEPTLSHALANSSPSNPRMKGAAQVDTSLDDAEVRNLGWAKAQMATPLIGGLNNEEVWMLVRRFNKVRRAMEQ
jgi:hypothetical protein